MRTFTEEEVEILLNSRVCEKPKTNADRIRSMSDEELAEFLCNVNQYSDMQVPSKEEINVMLGWLRSEVEE